jgi:hypothetical protein
VNLRTILSARPTVLQAMRVDGDGTFELAGGDRRLQPSDVVAIRDAWAAITTRLALGRLRELATSDEALGLYVFDLPKATSSVVAVIDGPAHDDIGARAIEIRTIVQGAS